MYSFRLVSHNYLNLEALVDYSAYYFSKGCANIYWINRYSVITKQAIGCLFNQIDKKIRAH